MKNIICIALLLLSATGASATPRFELGVGAGTTQPFANESF